MQSSRSLWVPSTEMDELQVRTERLLITHVGFDWRDRMWEWRQRDLARWAHEADARQAAIAGERASAEQNRLPRPPGGSLPQRLGNFVSHTRFHDYTSDYDAEEAQRRPRNDPANSRSLHPWWWIQNFDRYAPRMPPVEDTFNIESYHLFQPRYRRFLPDWLQMPSDLESEVWTGSGSWSGTRASSESGFSSENDGWTTSEGSYYDDDDEVDEEEDQAAYLARLRAENWEHFKQQFSSLGGAVRFIGRVLVRIVLDMVLAVRRRAG